jgi:hypothetical protein
MDQIPEMRPLQDTIRRHEIILAELSDIYAQTFDPSIVYDIMQAQVQSIRDYVIASGGFDNLPREESWDYFKSIDRNSIG